VRFKLANLLSEKPLNVFIKYLFILYCKDISPPINDPYLGRDYLSFHKSVGISNGIYCFNLNIFFGDLPFDQLYSLKTNFLNFISRFTLLKVVALMTLIPSKIIWCSAKQRQKSSTYWINIIPDIASGSLGLKKNKRKLKLVLKQLNMLNTLAINNLVKRHKTLSVSENLHRTSFY